MAISGGDSNVARERVNIPCAKHAGMRQWRVARNADAFRTRTVDGLKDGGRYSPTPSFLVTLISPTVALIPPAGKIRQLVFRQNAHKLCQPDC